MNYTNLSNISLPIALWLATDHYDLVKRPNVISVTTLIKPARAYLIARTMEPSEFTVDILDLFAARFGTALHAGVENAWVNHKDNLLLLGYPQKLVDRLIVNPESLSGDQIGVWLELRTERKIGNWIISGSCDMILDNAVHDVKSTSVWAWGGKNDEKYIHQLSLYRWLNPDRITKPTGYIEFLFKDWGKLDSVIKAKSNYPPFPVMQKPMQLWDTAIVELETRKKLSILDQHIAAGTLPQCTEAELWAEPTKYQYYGSHEAQRALKSFDNAAAAQLHLTTKGKGIIRVKVGKVKACTWCEVRHKCTQYKDLVIQGRIA